MSIKKDRFYWLYFFSIFLQGCSGSLEQKIGGVYSIEQYYYKEKDFYPLGNMIVLRKNGKCSLPVVKKNEHEYGSWKVTSDDGKVYLTIMSENKYFAGQYIVNFTEVADNGEVVRMQLFSRNMEMECARIW